MHCVKVIFKFLAIKIAPKKKRRCLTLDEKREILRLIDAGRSFSWIENHTETPRSTISKIKSSREKILQHFKVVENAGSVKKIRDVSHPEIEKATYYWFLQQRAHNLPITIDIIRQKAMVYHQSLCNIADCMFSASYGWTQKFIARHCMRSLKITGEKLSANYSAIEPFKEMFVKIVEEMEVSPEQIYNADESGLMWKMVPGYTLVGQEEKSAPGQKMNKARVTFTPCANITGTNKVSLQLIGKAAKPRCFAGKTLPKNINYCHSKNAWQTRELFKKWLSEVFQPSVEQYSKENGIPSKAILLLDNASAHTEYDNLSTPNIRVLFLPPNSTAIAQPMDQSVIYPIKVNYRVKLLQRLMLAQSWTEELKKFNLYDAVQLIGEAWDELEASVILKSWKPLLQGYKPYENLYQDRKDMTDLAESLVKKVTKMVKKLDVSLTEQDIDKWLNNVQELSSEQLTDENILQLIRTQLTSDAPKADESNEFQDSDMEENITLHYETVKDSEDHAEDAKNVDSAFLILIDHFKNNPDAEKLLHLRAWRNEFLDKVTLS